MEEFEEEVEEVIEEEYEEEGEYDIFNNGEEVNSGSKVDQEYSGF
jgi:hypothetical protein